MSEIIGLARTIIDLRLAPPRTSTKLFRARHPTGRILVGTPDGANIYRMSFRLVPNIRMRGPRLPQPDIFMSLRTRAKPRGQN